MAQEPIKLTSENVESVFKDCLSNDKDFMVKGVLIGASFDRQKVEGHREEITQMLMQLPTEFLKSKGGGWSFLNMCVDKDGSQWTSFHQMQDKLICLGIAIGAVDFLLPREVWKALPGGMPYIVVNDVPAKSDTTTQGTDDSNGQGV